MVTTAPRRSIRWLAPSPLWRRTTVRLAQPEHATQLRPAILRFANDDFVEELLAMLNHAPWRLSEWIAQPETWREPMPSPEPVVITAPLAGAPRPYNGTRLLQGPTASARRLAIATRGAARTAALPGGGAEPPLRLYQTSHQRYYVVAASLTSENACLSDYAVDLARSERATFVVRALQPRRPSGGARVEEPGDAAWGPNAPMDEYAFVTTRLGSAWQRVGPHDPADRDAATRRLFAGEEQLGSFVVTYADHCDRKHQMVGGLIPVGRREEWLKAPATLHGSDRTFAHPVPAEPGGAALMREVFRSSVVEPWKALVEQAELARRDARVGSGRFPNFGFDLRKASDDSARKLRDARDQIQTGSWYVLLDLLAFLKTYLPRIWAVLVREPGAPTLDDPEQAVLTALETVTLTKEQRFVLALENTLIANRDFEDGGLFNALRDLWELEEYLELERWPRLGGMIPPSIWSILLAEGVDMDLFWRFFDAYGMVHERSWYTVLDLLQLIEELTDRGSGPSRVRRKALGGLVTLNGLEQLIDDRLRAADAPSDFAVPRLSSQRRTFTTSLRDALLAVHRHEAARGGDGLEAVDVPYARVPPAADEAPPPPLSYAIDPRWPSFLFPLADPDPGLDASGQIPESPAAPDPRRLTQAMEAVTAAIHSLADTIEAQARTTLPPPPVDAPPGPQPLLDQTRTRFVVRFVFERPWCGEEIFPALVSAPTRQFELAPFFDPDAPARPLRIQLPTDISPATLRKYRKNAGFLISDMLCGKVKKIRKITFGDMVLDVLPWPFHKDLPSAGPTGPCRDPGGSLGMVCSLSIPIVTLAALIMLFVVVSLFDRFFRWIPYLFACFGIDLGGKDGSR